MKKKEPSLYPSAPPMLFFGVDDPHPEQESGEEVSKLVNAESQIFGNQELLKFFIECHKQLEETKRFMEKLDKTVLLLYGLTRSGKSMLTARMRLENVSAIDFIKLIPKNGETREIAGVRVANTYDSCTVVPEAYDFKDFILADLAGILERNQNKKMVIDLLNFILFMSLKKTKFLVVISAACFNHTNASQLLDYFKELKRLTFGDLNENDNEKIKEKTTLYNQLIECCYFVITHCDMHPDLTSKEIKSYISDMFDNVVGNGDMCQLSFLLRLKKFHCCIDYDSDGQKETYKKIHDLVSMNEKTIEGNSLELRDAVFKKQELVKIGNSEIDKINKKMNEELQNLSDEVEKNAFNLGILSEKANILYHSVEEKEKLIKNKMEENKKLKKKIKEEENNISQLKREVTQNYTSIKEDEERKQILMNFGEKKILHCRSTGSYIHKVIKHSKKKVFQKQETKEVIYHKVEDSFLKPPGEGILVVVRKEKCQVAEQFFRKLKNLENIKKVVSSEDFEEKREENGIIYTSSTGRFDNSLTVVKTLDENWIRVKIFSKNSHPICSFYFYEKEFSGEIKEIICLDFEKSIGEKRRRIKIVEKDIKSIETSIRTNNSNLKIKTELINKKKKEINNEKNNAKDIKSQFEECKKQIKCYCEDAKTKLEEYSRNPIILTLTEVQKILEKSKLKSGMGKKIKDYKSSIKKYLSFFLDVSWVQKREIDRI